MFTHVVRDSLRVGPVKHLALVSWYSLVLVGVRSGVLSSRGSMRDDLISVCTQLLSLVAFLTLVLHFILINALIMIQFLRLSISPLGHIMRWPLAQI